MKLIETALFLPGNLPFLIDFGFLITETYDIIRRSNLHFTTAVRRIKARKRIGARARHVATSSISLASVHNAKASSFRCGSSPNQSRGFDLVFFMCSAPNGNPLRWAFRLNTRAPSPSLCSVGRREGSRDASPQGVFPTHMSPEKQLN